MFKYEEEKRHTSQKVAAMSSLFQQLQGPVDEAIIGFDGNGVTHGGSRSSKKGNNDVGGT